MNVRNLVPWKRENQLTAPHHFGEASPFWDLHRQMDRVFDDFLQGFGGSPASRNGWSSGWPDIEVSETDKAVQVRAELPGMDEKDIDITLSDGVLSLSGEKKVEDNTSLYSERWHGRFTRSVQIGPEVDPDKVEALFKKGVLTISMAKRPEAQSRVKRITINGHS